MIVNNLVLEWYIFYSRFAGECLTFIVPTMLAVAIIQSTVVACGKKPGDAGSDSENGANQECQKPPARDNPKIYRECRNNKDKYHSECCNADGNSSNAYHKECGTGDNKAVSCKDAKK